MMSLRMNSCSFDQQRRNHRIMDEEEQRGIDCCVSSSSSSDGDDVSSVVSSDSDLFEDEEEEEEKVNSCGSASPTSPSSGSSSFSGNGALQDMSALLQELPSKRGLSKHYSGKSQSFTSLANVMSLEDLPKPENPYNKRLKSCKSYGLLLSSEKGSKGSCSSLGIKRNGSFLGNNNRPPIPPPQRSSSTCSFPNQTPLFV